MTSRMTLVNIAVMVVVMFLVGMVCGWGVLGICHIIREEWR